MINPVDEYIKYINAKALKKQILMTRCSTHPIYIYRGKSKTFKKNKRKGM